MCRSLRRRQGLYVGQAQGIVDELVQVGESRTAMPALPAAALLSSVSFEEPSRRYHTANSFRRIMAHGLRSGLGSRSEPE